MPNPLAADNFFVTLPEMRESFCIHCHSFKLFRRFRHLATILLVDLLLLYGELNREPCGLVHDLAVSRSLVDVLELHVPEQPDAAAPPQLCDDARLDRRRPLQHQSRQRVKLPAD